MANVSTSEVEEIYDGTVSDAAVAAASQLSDSLLSGCGYTTAQLKEIERWLAAHFQSSIDGNNGITGIKQGTRSLTSSSEFGRGLEASSYGQMAISLDTCGKLAATGKRKATFDVL